MGPVVAVGCLLHDIFSRPRSAPDGEKSVRHGRRNIPRFHRRDRRPLAASGEILHRVPARRRRHRATRHSRNRWSRRNRVRKIRASVRGYRLSRAGKFRAGRSARAIFSRHGPEVFKEDVAEGATGRTEGSFSPRRTCRPFFAVYCSFELRQGFNEDFFQRVQAQWGVGLAVGSRSADGRQRHRNSARKRSLQVVSRCEDFITFVPPQPVERQRGILAAAPAQNNFLPWHQALRRSDAKAALESIRSFVGLAQSDFSGWHSGAEASNYDHEITSPFSTDGGGFGRGWISGVGGPGRTGSPIGDGWAFCARPHVGNEISRVMRLVVSRVFVLPIEVERN